jgi:hypothetical protein
MTGAFLCVLAAVRGANRSKSVSFKTSWLV